MSNPSKLHPLRLSESFVQNLPPEFRELGRAILAYQDCIGKAISKRARRVDYLTSSDSLCDRVVDQLRLLAMQIDSYLSSNADADLMGPITDPKIREKVVRAEIEVMRGGKKLEDPIRKIFKKSAKAVKKGEEPGFPSSTEELIVAWRERHVASKDRIESLDARSLSRQKKRQVKKKLTRAALDGTFGISMIAANTAIIVAPTWASVLGGGYTLWRGARDLGSDAA